MRVLVCGSRDFNDYNKLKEELDAFRITEIIHGMARGADTLGGEYAKSNDIRLRTFLPRWDLYGKAAGPIRNAEMLKRGQPDLVIAFRGPNSRGTQDMINQARKAEVLVRIIDVP